MTGRQLPNLITLLRLAAVPVLYVLSLAETAAGMWVAGCFFGLLAASDWLDGYLARRLNAQTRFGTLLDPVVDKVLMLTVLFVFAARGLWPLWLVLLNMFREFAVSAVRHGLSNDRRAVGANWMGKTKFCMQAAFVGLAYAHLLMASAGRSQPGAGAFLFWCLLGITVVSYAFLARFALQHRARLTGAETTPEERSGP